MVSKNQGVITAKDVTLQRAALACNVVSISYRFVVLCTELPLCTSWVVEQNILHWKISWLHCASRRLDTRERSGECLY
jgi:hypothetical protein